MTAVHRMEGGTGVGIVNGRVVAVRNPCHLTLSAFQTSNSSCSPATDFGWIASADETGGGRVAGDLPLNRVRDSEVHAVDTFGPHYCV